MILRGIGSTILDPMGIPLAALGEAEGVGVGHQQDVRLAGDRRDDTFLAHGRLADRCRRRYLSAGIRAPLLHRDQLGDPGNKPDFGLLAAQIFQ